MLVDSWYDPYLGVVILVRVVNGVLKKGQQIKFMQAAPASGRPRRLHAAQDRAAAEIAAGEIGFITAQIKDISQTRVGDTITDARTRRGEAAARVQGSAAGGVLRAVPGRCQ
ncbi:MAG: EF-Tu/IF-2/RF-3 family GTPase [Sphingobium sp.]|jgi:GTP-binding protein LepA|nr:EF-Tu/IF-2/RF-3 family GTPase [Sphingobium sp.]